MIEILLLSLFVSPPLEGTVLAAQAPKPVAQPQAGTGQAAGQGASGPAALRRPVEISGDRFEIFNKRRRAQWSGHVTARRDNTVLTCDRAVADYTERQEITRIECTGGVEVTDGDKWARGDRADFDVIGNVVVVSGSPQARQGPNQMKGSKVTLFLGQDTMVVDNAKAIFETSPQGGTVLPRAGERKK